MKIIKAAITLQNDLSSINANKIVKEITDNFISEYEKERQRIFKNNSFVSKEYEFSLKFNLDNKVFEIIEETQLPTVNNNLVSKEEINNNFILSYYYDNGVCLDPIDTKNNAFSYLFNFGFEREPEFSSYSFNKTDNKERWEFQIDFDKENKHFIKMIHFYFSSVCVNEELYNKSIEAIVPDEITSTTFVEYQTGFEVKTETIKDFKEVFKKLYPFYVNIDEDFFKNEKINIEARKEFDEYDYLEILPMYILKGYFKGENDFQERTMEAIGEGKSDLYYTTKSNKIQYFSICTFIAFILTKDDYEIDRFIRKEQWLYLYNFKIAMNFCIEYNLIDPDFLKKYEGDLEEKLRKERLSVFINEHDSNVLRDEDFKYLREKLL